MSDTLTLNTIEEEQVSEESVFECRSGLSILEHDYKFITAQLQENDDLQEFLEAYNRLYSAFSESYQNDQDLEYQISQLQLEIEQYREIITLQEKNSEELQSTIENLELQLAQAKKLCDHVHVREQVSQEIIEHMRTQIGKLNADLELKSEEAAEKEGTFSKTQEGYEREMEKMMDEIINLKTKLKNALSYSEELEQKNSIADLKCNTMLHELEQNKGEIAKKQHQLDKSIADISFLNQEIEDLHSNLNEIKETVKTDHKQISTLETQIKTQKSLTEKANKHSEMVQVKLDKCQMELNISTLDLNDLKEKHIELTKSCKLKVDECNSLRSDVIKLTKQKDNMEKKLMQTERLKYNIEQERNQLSTNVQMMEREIILGKKQNDSDSKTISGLVKEKHVLSKNVIRLQATIEGHIKLIQIEEQKARRLELEIRSLINDIRNEKNQFRKMEKERNRAISETLDLTQQVEDAMDENNLKQKAIFDLKKLIVELETKLRQQLNLFETIRSERNNLQKQFHEANGEIEELKSKHKLINHQCQQLKDDIVFKEAECIKQDNLIKKLQRDKISLKTEVQNGVDRIKDLNHEIKELLQNERQLINTIGTNEKIIKEKQTELEQIVNDRDTIGAQLVRRNDEIDFIRDKNCILEITLFRGKTEYEQRIQDIKLLKTEIKSLIQEKNYLSKSISSMTDLKTEVFTLERELAGERLKCRALQDELQHPMNIHRWRKLRGSDPRYMDLWGKSNILQKRLLALTSRSIEREKQLKETEKLYFNLRQALANQPSPEIKSELTKTKRALSLRGVRMKCLVSELNMYEAQAKDYKTDLEKMSTELIETKKKYYEQRKLCQSNLGKIKLPAIKGADADIGNK